MPYPWRRYGCAFLRALYGIARHPIVHCILLFFLFQLPLSYVEIRQERFRQLQTWYDAPSTRDSTLMWHSAQSTVPLVPAQFTASPWGAIRFISQCASTAVETYVRLYSWIVWLPLMQLYLKGPTLHGYGFWNGKADRDICAQLSNLSSDAFHRDPYSCFRLLFQHVDSFLIATHFLTLLFLLYCCLQYVYYRFVYFMPMWNMVNRMHETNGARITNKL